MPKRFVEQRTGTSYKKVGKRSRKGPLKAKPPTYTLKAPVEWKNTTFHRLLSAPNEKTIHLNTNFSLDHPDEWYNMLKSVYKAIVTTDTYYAGSAASGFPQYWSGIKIANNSKQYVFRNNGDGPVYLTCFLVEARKGYKTGLYYGKVDNSNGSGPTQQWTYSGSSGGTWVGWPIMSLFTQFYIEYGAPVTGTHNPVTVYPSDNTLTPTTGAGSALTAISMPLEHTIFDSRYFTRGFKVLRVVKRKITQGSSFIMKHTSKTKGRKKNEELMGAWAQDGSPSAAEMASTLDPRCSFWMFQIHGDLGHRRVLEEEDVITNTCPNSIASVTTPAYTPCSLDMAIHHLASWNPVQLEWDSGMQQVPSTNVSNRSIYDITVDPIEMVNAPDEGEIIQNLE